MDKSNRQHGGPGQAARERDVQRSSGPAPGKVTRTSKLSPDSGAAVQRKPAPAGSPSSSPQSGSPRDAAADSWMDAAHRGATAVQRKADPVQREEKGGATTQAAATEEAAPDKPKYVVSDKKAFIRDDNFQKVEGDKTIPRWTEVVVEKTATNGSTEYSYVTSPDGSTVYGWTSSSNLYSLSWNPKDHEETYKKLGTAYNDQMQAVDPAKTRADLIKSGTGVKAVVDKYYPNSTDPAKLDTSFKGKVDKMIAGFQAQGITASANAGLRHPLRSTVFHYAIAVAAAADENIIHEANAVSTKYGIPIDWAHTNDAGAIDLKTSKAKAGEVKAEFGIKKDAAAGIKDFGGTISNHNNGKAVDLSLSFSFSKTKEIKVGDKTYSVDPALQRQDTIPNISQDGLTLFGSDQYGLKRAIDTDPVHWSESGR
jgi:hypothetical protein